LTPCEKIAIGRPSKSDEAAAASGIQCALQTIAYNIALYTRDGTFKSHNEAEEQQEKAALV
jgi:hypothetical protein